MVHLLDAAHGAIDGSRIADVAVDELDVALDLAQAAQGPAGIIVEDAHRFAPTHEGLDQGRAEKAAAAGNQNAPRAHRLTFPPLPPPAYHIRHGRALPKPVAGGLRWPTRSRCRDRA